ncbi:MAG TPA: GDSL-type esterase/lipase family protein [Paenisporosarcina sp.]|nr:GDSL-type esterase/lipase family protein [Paenisporosarcina sp.]
MRNWQRRWSSLAFMFVLLVAFLVPTASANTEAVRYLALGDSLAAGMTPTNQIDKGYADYAADYLQGKNMLNSFSKDFSYPGDTTDDLLSKLTTNVQLQEAVKQSNTITISAGANDLLKDAKFDSEKQILIIDETKVPATLQKLAINYTMILKSIKELNPNAKVFVMGYYFPYPYVADVQKPKLIELTHTLNKTIQLASVSQGATFVSIYEKFGDDPKKYLPNPINIHPNAEGYMLMSEAFLASLANPTVVVNDIPAGHWAEKELKLLLNSKIYNLDGKGNVYPQKPITRAEVANILFGLI